MSDQPQPLPKRKPKGQPITWAEADLDRMSEITDADKQALVEFWKANASPALQNLLDAKPDASA